MLFMQLQKNSIVYKLTLFVICMIIAQAVLLTGLMAAGGVLQQAKDNAYESFYEKVKNRNSYIQREMKYRWGNVSPFINEFSSNPNEWKNESAYFNKVMPRLMDMLRTTQATGAFIVLKNHSAEDTLPALYIRDYDPLTNDFDNDDLYMLFGPSKLAQDNGIPLDENWHSHLSEKQSMLNFYQKPYRSAVLTNNPKLLGYWSTPFKFYADDTPIITYTMPLFDNQKNLIGVVGIEISVQSLIQYLPATDLQPKDSLGYLIAYKNGNNANLLPIVTHGALQKRMIHENEPLELSLRDEKRELYLLSNHNSKESLFAVVEKIGLSSSNTPFESEEWYLIGLMTENNLLSYVSRIQSILWTSLLLSIFIGALGGVYISYRFSKPILELSKKVRESERSKLTTLEPTGLLEVDQLAQTMTAATSALLESTTRMSRIIELVDEPIAAFELRNNGELLLTTDQVFKILSTPESSIMSTPNPKKAFESLLEELLKHPEEEENDVYKLQNAPNKWVKLKTYKTDTSLLGVITDVSREMIGKKEIMLDRDLDPLTGLYNRKAFQKRYENWYQNHLADVSALLMFDLDNLKVINDNFGHRWGDIYIKLCVKVLMGMAEPGQMLLGRRSGDEFVMLLHDFPSKEALRRTVASFYKRLGQELIIFPDHSNKPLTISSGLVWITDLEAKDASYDTLLQRADEALYDSKRHNKGSYTEAK